MVDNQLNNAYYGPSIPSPSKSDYRRHNNNGCSFCSCFKGCSLICKIITTIIVLVAIIGFLFWFIVRPDVLKFSVSEASLTIFNFTKNNTFNYDLSVNILIQNPNRRVGIDYEDIKMYAFYKNLRFGSQTLGKFFQPHKNTSNLSAAFKGKQGIHLSSNQMSKFNKEKNDGVYGIDLKVFLNLRCILGLFKSGNVKTKLHCDLKVPLTSHNGTSSSLANGFEATNCDWVYKWRLFH